MDSIEFLGLCDQNSVSDFLKGGIVPDKQLLEACATNDS